MTPLRTFLQQHVVIHRKPTEEKVADVIFFKVGVTGTPDPEELKRLLKEHKGEFCDCDPLDGKEHSYIELGGFIGDQGVALCLMGVGSLLGIWKLLTPRTVLSADMDDEMARSLAGQGFLSVVCQ